MLYPIPVTVMYTLFNDPRPAHKSPYVIPEIQLAKPLIKNNLLTCIKREASFTTSVRADHILASILQQLNLSVTQNPLAFKYRADDLGMQLSTPLNITSPIHCGGVRHTPHFIYHGREILLGSKSEFDPEEAISRWRLLKPVKFLRHPYTTTNPIIPNATTVLPETGYTVIEINIGLLACMWRGWRLEELMYNSANPHGVTHFISMWVLPSMLGSWIDQAWINRIKHALLSLPIDNTSGRLGYQLLDTNSKLLVGVEKLVQQLRQTPVNYSVLLEAMPALVKSSVSKVVGLPRQIATNNNTFALCLARLSIWELLLELDPRASKNEIYETRQVLASAFGARDFDVVPLGDRPGVKTAILQIKNKL